MPAGSDYTVSKDLFGRRSVKYECPYCSERLRSSLRDAGSLDYCPTCQRGFTVPGIETLKQVTEASAAAEAYAAKVKAERKEAKRRHAQQKAAARARARQQAEEWRKAGERIAEEARQASVKDLPATNADVDRPAKAGRRWAPMGALAATILVVMTAYGLMRGADLRSKLDVCELNGIVNVRVNYSGLFNNDTVVFDLRDGGAPDARRIDPVHLLMQFADKLDFTVVRRVVLARNGRPQFYIASSDLRQLADSYASGGRLWAFNNLPANVRRMDGTRAFDEWTGGWLGVLKEQTEDVNDFITEWTGYGDAGYSALPSATDSTLRSHVRQTLQEMEDNVPETLEAMEDNLPEVMADIEARMMEDAAEYGLSPSEVKEQLGNIEEGARDQIRGMENKVRDQIRGMEDDVIESF